MEEIFTIPFKINFVLDEILLFISSLFLLITCFWLIISRNLIESIILLSVFSLFLGLCYLFMDAPDVAMTETALGACLSTCVLLNVAKIVGEDSGKLKKLNTLFALILCAFFAVILTWISLELPSFGTQDSEVQTHLTKYYLQNTRTDIAIPSFVAAILASYRGYDTLGETIVILIAGLAVLVIVSRKKSNA